MSETFTGFGELPFGQDDLSLMTFIARQITNGMATAAIVLVKAVHEETVDVQPMVNQIDGKGTGIPHGTINGLPFFKLRAGNSAVRLKPKVGDIGVALFTSSDSSVVKKTKKIGNPGSRRRFDWSDGLYFGGFLGGTETTIVDLDDDVGVTITVPSGKKVKITGDVEITGDVTVSGTLTADTDVVGGGKSLKTHTHGSVQTGSGTSGPPS